MEEDFCEWEPSWHLPERRAGIPSSWLGVSKLCWTLWGEGVLQKMGSSVWVGLLSGGPQAEGTGTGPCVGKGDEGCSLSTWDSVVQSMWAESRAWTPSPVLTCQPGCPFRLSRLGTACRSPEAWVPRLESELRSSLNLLPALLLGLGLSPGGRAGSAGLALCGSQDLKQLWISH